MNTLWFSDVVAKAQEEKVLREMMNERSSEPAILRVAGVAQILGMSEQAVRNAISRGQEGKTIPKSFKLGHRRVWLKQEVFRFLDDLGAARVNQAPHPRL